MPDSARQAGQVALASSVPGSVMEALRRVHVSSDRGRLE
jgi:hypothetical protein